jgi:type II secretory pathway pseudopilin PulG
MKTAPMRRPKPSEEGYMLVTVMFILAILMISMTALAPAIKKSIQRDREVELMHRGKQYARAVKLYYKQFGAYPTSVDILLKANNQRFLRKKYVDLSTGKDQWKIIIVGQQKTPPMGFFGKPLGAAGATGGSGITGATSFGNSGSSTFGSSNGGSMFGSSSGGSTFGSSSAGSSSFSSSAGTSGSSTGPGGGAAGGATGAGGSTGSQSGTDSFGQPTMVGPIIGFSPNSSKESILVYRLKNHYDEWEFLYSPIEEQATQGPSGNMGLLPQPGGAGTGNGFSINLNGPGSGSNTGAGGNQGGGSNPAGSNGNSGNGNGNGSGSGSGSGNPPNSPTPPPTQ